MFATSKSNLYKKEESEKYYDEKYARKGSFAYMDDWHEEKKRRLFNLIKELDLPERGDALDFGCGSGVLTEVIKAALPNYPVYGMDLSHPAIDKARERYKKCHFFHSSDTSYNGKKFDFPLSHPIDAYARHKAEEEWRHRKKESNGSEMYLVYFRPGNSKLRQE